MLEENVSLFFDRWSGDFLDSVCFNLLSSFDLPSRVESDGTRLRLTLIELWFRNFSCRSIDVVVYSSELNGIRFDVHHVFFIRTYCCVT